MIGALQAWADENGRSPRRIEWKLASPAHPTSMTVCAHFGDWSRALRRADLPPAAPPLRHPWSDSEIITALQVWAVQQGRAPAHLEWVRGNSERPCAQTVWLRFGGWSAALRAAGLEPPPRIRPKPRPLPRAQAVDRWLAPALLEKADVSAKTDAALPARTVFARAWLLHPVRVPRLQLLVRALGGFVPASRLL